MRSTTFLRDVASLLGSTINLTKIHYKAKGDKPKNSKWGLTPFVISDQADKAGANGQSPHVSFGVLCVFVNPYHSRSYFVTKF